MGCTAMTILYNVNVCFIDVLQMELHRVAQEWNLHRFNPSNNTECHPGKPGALNFVPETVDA